MITNNDKRKLRDDEFPCPWCRHDHVFEAEHGRWVDMTCARCGEAVGSYQNTAAIPRMDKIDKALIILSLMIMAWIVLRR